MHLPLFIYYPFLYTYPLQTLSLLILFNLFHTSTPAHAFTPLHILSIFVHLPFSHIYSLYTPSHTSPPLIPLPTHSSPPPLPSSPQVLTADADKAIQPYQRSSSGLPPLPKHVEACRRLYPFRQPIGG